MSKRILIVTGDAAEVLEVYYPYYRVLEEGYEAIIAAPVRKVLHTVVHDFVEGWIPTRRNRRICCRPISGSRTLTRLNTTASSIPGDERPNIFAAMKIFPCILSHFLEADKPVGAICHGVQVFASLQDTTYFKGRTMTAYNACRLDVERLGASYAKETLHVDGRLVSGHAWPDLPGFMREFLSFWLSPHSY